MDDLNVIPGTAEYREAKQHADTWTKQRREQGLPLAGLEQLREKARRVFPDITFDPRFILHSSQYYEHTTQSEILELLPEGFFTEYQTYARGSIAPVLYDFLASLNLLGAWIGRRARITMGEWYHIFPPCSVMLISMNPGLGKGIAMRANRRLLNLAGYPWLAPDRISASMFLGILAQQTSNDEVNPSEMAIHATELAGFFRNHDQSTGGLIIDLADLMDMPERFEYATRVHGHEEIKMPTVSVIGGSNMDWLIRHMPREAFTGGYFPRQYIAVCTREDSPLHDQDYPPPEDAVHNLIGTLGRIRTLRGEVTLEPCAVDFYIGMRQGAIRKVRHEDDERKAAYWDRQPTNALRMAMLFALSQGNQVVSLTDLQRAAGCLEILEETHHHLFDRIGLTPYGQLRQAMLDIIERYGETGLTRTDLKVGMLPHGVPRNQFDEMLEDLNDSELIVTTSATQNSRQTILIRAKKHLRKTTGCVIVMPNSGSGTSKASGEGGDT
jgi:hypothetical protein